MNVEQCKCIKESVKSRLKNVTHIKFLRAFGVGTGVQNGPFLATRNVVYVPMFLPSMPRLCLHDMFQILFTNVLLVSK